MIRGIEKKLLDWKENHKHIPIVMTEHDISKISYLSFAVVINCPKRLHHTTTDW